MLLLRVTPIVGHRKAFKAMGAGIAAWTLASLLAAAFACDLRQPWLLAGAECAGDARIYVLSTFDMTFEITIVCGAVSLVWGLHTGRRVKLAVVVLFSFRLM
jgi:hypothetical protein